MSNIYDSTYSGFAKFLKIDKQKSLIHKFDFNNSETNERKNYFIEFCLFVVADPVSMLSGTQNLEPAVEKANEPVTITDKMESEEPLKRRFSRRSTGVKMSQVPDVVETSTLIALASTAGVDESVNQDSKREEQVNIFK